MPFRFRLEKVLAVRRLQEEGAQARHGAALASLREAEERIEELSSAVVRTLEELDRLKLGDELTTQAIYLHTLHVAGLKRQLQVARANRTSAQIQVDRTAAELLEAHQAREALERLRERQEAAWRQDEAAKDARAIDEIAVSRHRAREEESHGP